MSPFRMALGSKKGRSGWAGREVGRPGECINWVQHMRTSKSCNQLQYSPSCLLQEKYHMMLARINIYMKFGHRVIFEVLGGVEVVEVLVSLGLGHEKSFVARTLQYVMSQLCQKEKANISQMDFIFIEPSIQVAVEGWLRRRDWFLRGKLWKFGSCRRTRVDFSPRYHWAMLDWSIVSRKT